MVQKNEILSEFVGSCVVILKLPKLYLHYSKKTHHRVTERYSNAPVDSLTNGSAPLIRRLKCPLSSQLFSESGIEYPV